MALVRLPASLGMALCLLLLFALAGCSVGGRGVFGTVEGGGNRAYSVQDRVQSSGNGRYVQRVDSAPSRPQDVSAVADAEPRVEPRSRRGNAASYTVFGETYRVLESSRGFTQVGTASWYGNKFHGYETANGEVYDMYAMTAAHKTLPLPTYLRVTNLDNNRQIIVRVNDRGPFIGNRILDLSYAAASRLDMLSTGTARVRIEAIDPVQWQAQRQRQQQTSQPAEPAAGDRVFLQVAALSSVQAAEQLQARLATVTSRPTRILADQSGASLYRVQIGPLEAVHVEAAIQQLEHHNFGRPLLVRQ